MPIEPPQEQDLDRIATQWLRAEELVRLNVGTELAMEPQGLDQLQALLDSGNLKSSDTYDLQCLGIAFGRILVASGDGLDWAVHNDEYGRDPTVRYGDTSLAINVLTLVSKRMEDERSVDLRDLMDRVLADVRRLAEEVD